MRDRRLVETVNARATCGATSPRRPGSAAIPGLQYDTTINDWHTSAETARINASNPCSEYMYLDDSACNLASLNLRKFVRPTDADGGEFDVESFRRAVEIDHPRRRRSSSATPSTRPSRIARQLARLPAARASATPTWARCSCRAGCPTTQRRARAYAGAITALMTGRAYRTSAVIARDVTGPFDGYAENREPFLGVMKKHRQQVDKIDSTRSCRPT